MGLFSFYGGPRGGSVTHQNLLILCATPPRHRRACGFRSPPAVTPQTKNSHCKSENFLSGGPGGDRTLDAHLKRVTLYH